MATDWGSNTSVIAAVVSAIAAWVAAHYARRAHKLALEQETRLRPSIGLYLVNGHIRRLTSRSQRVFVFRLLITNESDAANALKEMQLVIHYSRERGGHGAVSISHNLELAVACLEKGQEALKLPCTISTRAVIGGIAAFGAAEELLKNHRIESAAVDTFGNRAEREVILLQET